jgi:hypothetical protein
MTWGEVSWESSETFDLDLAATTVVRDDGKGTLRTNKGSVLKIADPTAPVMAQCHAVRPRRQVKQVLR